MSENMPPATVIEKSAALDLQVIAMASNLVAMASNLLAMDSNLIATAAKVQHMSAGMGVCSEGVRRS